MKEHPLRDIDETKLVTAIDENDSGKVHILVISKEKRQSSEVLLGIKDDEHRNPRICHAIKHEYIIEEAWNRCRIR